ncbi:AsmA family protein [Galbibacter mesophilus]|uniref:hypothetical protein n=1 Tax=Galbibacter mesophilus TaxID=379069 RepID=UPI00191E757A|nr:hypothetical protein [Galbibacter mesophilus]MCM5662271.1 hypothetical protein [Galbibacter mesophilus]
MKKKLLYTLLISFGILAILIISANLLLPSFIEKKIRKQVSEYNLDIGKTYVNVLTRNISFEDVHISNEKKDSAFIENIDIESIALQNLFKPDTFKIGTVYVNNAKGFLQKKEKSTKKNSAKPFKISIENIQVENSEIKYKTDTIKDPISVKNIAFYISDFLFDSEIDSQSKFNFDEITLSCDSLLLPINEHLNFTTENISATNDRIKFSHSGITTLYSKQELQKHVKVQTDWIALSIDSITIDEFKKDKNGARDLFKSPRIGIYSGDLEIYKNKLLPPPNKYKPLYSKALRQLPFDLKIDSILIHDTKIKYAERVKNHDKPGSIVFTEINSSIAHLNTLENSGKTEIDITSKFMGDADFELLWDFDINNENDYFTLHGNMKRLNAEKINEFVKPNMNVITEGSIDSIIFDLFANEDNATGTFLMQYDHFKLSILQKDKKVVNKFVTSIANIFIPKDKHKSKKVHIEIERNKEKSFFNYFWLSVREGVKQTFL